MKRAALSLLLLGFVIAGCASGGEEKGRKPTPGSGERLLLSGDEKLANGNVRGARRRYKTALALFQKVDDLQKTSITYHRLGKTALIKNDLKAARSYIISAKVIANSEHYSGLLQELSISEASLLIAEGNPEKAGEALKGYSSVNNGTMENARGRVALALGDINGAKLRFKSALSTGRSMGDLSTESAALANLGTLFLKGGEPDKAIENLKMALTIDKKTETVLSIGSTLHLIGRAHEAKGLNKSALYFYNRALKANSQTGIAARIKTDRTAIERVEKLINSSQL